jgi:hypothetical protein
MKWSSTSCLSFSEKSVQQKDLQKKLDTQYQKALEGFVLIIAREGDIMYLSENVSKYLGITQVCLLAMQSKMTHYCWRVV